METLQIAVMIMQILLNLYGQDYKPEIDWFLLTEESNENIVLIADFKGADEIIICDNELFYKCGFQNKQKIIRLGLIQALIKLDTYPHVVPEKFYVHILNKGKPTHLKGYKMQMGFTYNRIHQLKRRY